MSSGPTAITAVTFPISFSYVPYNVVATISDADYGYATANGANATLVSVNNANNSTPFISTSFQLTLKANNAFSATMYVYWMAIGPA